MSNSTLKKILYVDHVAGMAGDMFAAACLDSGLVPKEDLVKIPEALGFDDVQIAISRVIKAGWEATHIDVSQKKNSWELFFQSHPDLKPDKNDTEDHHHHHEHSYSQDSHPHNHYHSHNHAHFSYSLIKSIIGEAKLKDSIRQFALSIYASLAKAESSVHGISLDKVIFHEVGNIDSIIDAVMAAVCLDAIKPDQVFSSAVKLGRGLIKIEHGSYPVPPPATVNLCQGFPIESVPQGITRSNIELSTPTGMAILGALNPVFVDSWPSGILSASGAGAGTRDLGQYPNVLRIALFETSCDAESAQSRIENLPYEHTRITEITFNIDDETPERCAWLLQKVLERGALDAYFAPLTGKKNRPAVLMTVLCNTVDASHLIDWLLRFSPTFGLRWQLLNKSQLMREFETRESSHGSVRYKIGKTTTGEVIKEKPEYEDLDKIWETHPNYRPGMID